MVSDEALTWSAPAALNTNAATDQADPPAQDFVPDVTTDGTGSWVAVWVSPNPLGGTIGTDNDLLVARGAGPDTDGDGLRDGPEANVYGTDPESADTDADGLTDGAEVNTHATDPTDPDTDADGFTDAEEVAAGSDPNDPDSTPETLPIPALPLAGLALLGLWLPAVGRWALRPGA